MKKKKTRQKRKLKLDPRLTKSIFRRPPPKPKVPPKYRARLFAWLAAQDLRSFAATIHGAAKADNKLFFDYLAKYLRKQPIRLPISENERRLLMLLSQNPHISAEEALKQLGWTISTGYYGV